jgi:hypothetical protein
MFIEGKIITISKKEITQLIRQDRKETIELYRKAAVIKEEVIDENSIIKRPIDQIKKNGVISFIMNLLK